MLMWEKYVHIHACVVIYYDCELGPYSPTILKNIQMYTFSPRFVNLNVTQLLKPYGIANQKLCYIQTLPNLEKIHKKTRPRTF